MDQNQLLSFLSQFQNPIQWLESIYLYEKEKFIKIFPERTHEQLFDNFVLNESDLKSHLTFSISGCLLGIHPKNKNKNNIMCHINDHVVYSHNGINFTFTDVLKIFETFNY